MLSPLRPALLLTLLSLPLAAMEFTGIRAGEFTTVEWQWVRDQAGDPTGSWIDSYKAYIHPQERWIHEVPPQLATNPLAQRGLVDVTALGAIPDDLIDDTAALQAAIDLARDYQMVCFLPAGRYRVSNTLYCTQSFYADLSSDGDSVSWQRGDHMYSNALLGATSDPARRAVLVVPAGTPAFADPANPRHVVQYRNLKDIDAANLVDGQPTYGGESIHYNQTFTSIDIEIGADNRGAIGLRLRGAEGCGVYDTTITLADNSDGSVGGVAGINGLPGSGGSSHRITVRGGAIGIDLHDEVLDTVDNQPGITISQLVCEGQSLYALRAQVRGTCVVVGGRLIARRAGPLLAIKPHWSKQPWDSALVLVDVEARWTAPSGNGGNVLIQHLDRGGTANARSYYLSNVFLHQADKVDSRLLVPAYPGGWRHIRELAASIRPLGWGTTDPVQPRERVVIDGVAVADNGYVLDHEDHVQPGEDLLAKHGWGGLPGVDLAFRDPTQVCDVRAFGAVGDGVADDTAALRAAIAAAHAGGKRMVFLPKGQFLVSDTITLEADTALVGIHHNRSVIRGVDVPGKRFGNNPDPTTIALPIVDTVDAADARTAAVNVGIEWPCNTAQHAAADVGCHALRWRAGRSSVVRHVYPRKYTNTNWRLGYVYRDDALFKNVVLETANPVVQGGYRFDAPYNARRTTWAMVENLGSSGWRLMTTSNVRTPFTRGARLTITRDGGGSFALASLKLGHGLYPQVPGFPAADFAVTLTGTTATGGTLTATQNLSLATARSALVTLSPGWNDLTQVVLTAPYPFGLDDVVLDDATVDFTGLTTDVAGESGSWNAFLGTEHYPAAATVHPQVLITGHGGGHWYNFWYHGDVWAHPTYRHVVVRDTSEPLQIYHWHLQHIHSDAQAEFNHARHVSVYGSKAEHNSRFLDVISSDHIRLFGYGGLADAKVGEAHILVRDTPNFLRAAGNEEPYLGVVNGVPSTEVFGGTQDNPLIRNHVSTFDGLIEEQGGVRVYDDAAWDRPILIRRGRPLATPEGDGAVVRALRAAPSTATVALEAEQARWHHPAGGHWWLPIADAAAAGGRAMQALPDLGTTVDSAIEDGSPCLSYQVAFASAGTYRVWVRGKAVTGAATGSDSLHAGLDGVAVASARAITGFTTTYGWSATTAAGPAATLAVTTAGVHTVNIWMCEDSFTLDRLVLTTDTGLTPSGTGPTTTSLVTVNLRSIAIGSSDMPVPWCILPDQGRSTDTATGTVFDLLDADQTVHLLPTTPVGDG